MKSLFTKTKDGYIPAQVSEFLESSISISKFNEDKKLFSNMFTLQLENKPLAEHMDSAYHLINFWKNLYLNNNARFGMDNVSIKGFGPIYQTGSQVTSTHGQKKVFRAFRGILWK